LKGTDPAILPQRRGSFIRHAMMKKNWPTHARVMADSRPCRELAQDVCSLNRQKSTNDAMLDLSPPNG
jgi:hypothetical protein